MNDDVRCRALLEQLANGELRMTLTPADADDTDKMIQAYLA